MLWLRQNKKLKRSVAKRETENFNPIITSPPQSICFAAGYFLDNCVHDYFADKDFVSCWFSDLLEIFLCVSAGFGDPTFVAIGPPIGTKYRISRGCFMSHTKTRVVVSMYQPAAKTNVWKWYAALKNSGFYAIIYYRWAMAQPKQPCGRNSMRFLF